MKLKKRAIIIVLVVLVGLVSVGGVVMNRNKSKEVAFTGPKEGQLVKVSPSEKKDIQTKVSASGMLYADVSEVLFSESNNKVVVINKKVGDSVKKGEVILTLDKDVKDKMVKEIDKVNLSIETAKIALAQMQSGSKQEVLSAQSSLAEIEKSENDIKESIRSVNASLKTAQTDKDTAIKDYDLTNQLFTEGLASQQELDKAKKDLDLINENMTTLNNKLVLLEQDSKNLAIKKESANYNLSVLLNASTDQKKAQSMAIKQNDIKSLQLQKETLQDELAKVTDTIVSPIDGVIAEVMVEEGSSIVPGKELVKVIEPTKLIVKSEVAPFYAAQLKEGLPASIKYNGSQTIELEGKISKVSPTAVTKVGANNVSTTTVPVEIEIIGDTAGLKPGLVVDVRIVTTDVKDVVAVPLLATMEDKDGETYLFVVEDDFTLEKRQVKAGVADNQYVEIQGLEEGEIIVTNPTEALNDDTIVKYEPLEVKEEGENQ